MLFWICFIIAFIPVSIMFPIKVIGRKRLPKKQGFVLTCNHYTNFDAPMIDVKIRRKVRFLAKKELFKNKFNGFFIKKFGGYPIDRGSTDVKAFKFALQTLKDKHILGIFPEGTRNKSGSEEMGDIKSGAIVFASKANVPIVPMVLVKPIKFLRRTTLIIGDPFMCEGENPTRLTKDEIEKNVELLAEKTNALREEYNNGIEEKRNRKKLK